MFCRAFAKAFGSGNTSAQDKNKTVFAAQPDVICQSDVPLLVFPLYADSLPSHMLHLLANAKANGVLKGEMHRRLSAEEPKAQEFDIKTGCAASQKGYAIPFLLLIHVSLLSVILRRNTKMLRKDTAEVKGVDKANRLRNFLNLHIRTSQQTFGV